MGCERKTDSSRMFGSSMSPAVRGLGFGGWDVGCGWAVKRSIINPGPLVLTLGVGVWGVGGLWSLGSNINPAVLGLGLGG